jgi:hypothetical protein
MMAPWELRGSDESLLPYWLKLKPEDFYFAIKREGNTTVVCITPGEYYDAAGMMYPDSMPINRYLPVYLIETLESIYETSEPLSRVFEDLLQTGFIHDSDFQSYIEIAK